MNKICCICENEFPATTEFFHRRNSSEDGLRCDCKICRKEKKLKNYLKDNKKCSKCGIEKPNTEEYFNIRNGGKRARTRSLCIECARENSKYNHITKKYNLTKNDYEEMYINQNYKCFICSKEVNLVVDHDHTTGEVRKLLCDNCNLGLGAFKENIEIMSKAIEYIKHHNKNTN